MAEGWFQQMDKQKWNKVSFYINVFLFIVIAISVVLIILDSYNAGKVASSQFASSDDLSQAWIYIGRDIAFLAVSIALIFFQFFRNLRLIIQRSW
jgi:hypothetical protein